MANNYTISEAEAQKKMSDLVTRTKDAMDRFIITRNGKPEAVLMSYKEYEGLLETLDILSNPEEVREILKTSQEMARGEYATYEEVFGEPLHKN